MLKLVCLKKLKEDYPDIKLRMELPGGLDTNRVTLPVLLSSPPPPQSPPAEQQQKSDGKQKNKTGGLFGLFKATPVSPETQPQNNATGSTASNISFIIVYYFFHIK